MHLHYAAGCSGAYMDSFAYLLYSLQYLLYFIKFEGGICYKIFIIPLCSWVVGVI